MDEEQQPEKPRSALEEAEAEGMDISLIECNLKKTVWERMLNHDRALAFALELRAAMERRQANVST